MPTSVYFSPKVTTEQFLYEDIIIESLKMYGQDIYYLPREIISVDNILNEDIESNFNSTYMVEMYIENTQGFDGDGELLSKFGIELRDQATFIVSKRRWEQLVGSGGNGIVTERPAEGDLIYLPLTQSLFEVRFVENESPFYQLSDLPTYSLQCEIFEYSGETINTGNPDIDVVNSELAMQVAIVINNSNGIDFAINESIQQETTPGSGEYITGRLITREIIDSTSSKLFIADWATTDGEYHNFNTIGTIQGISSGAVWSPVSVNDINSPITSPAFPSDSFAANQVFEQAADSIIDFSESNPFGDIT